MLRKKDANATITLLEKMTWKKKKKKKQALNGIRTHDLCVTGAVLYKLSYQSHMRAVVFEFGPLCSVDVILGSRIWIPAITMEFIYLSRVLRPLNI